MVAWLMEQLDQSNQNNWVEKKATNLILEAATEEARQKIAIGDKQSQAAKVKMVHWVEAAEEHVIQVGGDASRQVLAERSFQEYSQRTANT